MVVDILLSNQRVEQMKIIKDKQDAYTFISDSGLKYSLYEGLTISDTKRYTSDIVFIVLDLYDTHPMFVDFWYGATLIDFSEPNKDDILKDISVRVNKWEEENKDKITGLTEI